MNIHTLSSDCIQSISTRFFYEGEKLCYRIELAYQEKEKELFFEEFKNYKDYQQSHEELLQAVQNQKVLTCNFHKSAA